MAGSAEERLIRSLLEQVDVTINGGGPIDIQVHDDRFYRRVAAGGSLAFGESYMDGWWDCERLDDLFARVIAADYESQVSVALPVRIRVLLHKVFNVQTIRQGQRLADTHYNISPPLFERMLGETMTYSCAYWRDADTLDDAQRAKLDLVCRKLELGEQDRLLDIGCGWGGFARYAAETHGCHVVGVTISRSQAAYARDYCASLPVEIVQCDYREIAERYPGGSFTKIGSIGMFEHVGRHHYRTFMEIAHGMLVKEGLFLLHSIGSHRASGKTADPWFEKYIFPGGVIPSLPQIAEAQDRLFILEDLQNIGYDYAPTLRAWYDRFEEFWNDDSTLGDRPELRGSRDLFYRMWRYYLLSASGNFRARAGSVWQMVFSKVGTQRLYAATRS